MRANHRIAGAVALAVTLTFALAQPAAAQTSVNCSVTNGGQITTTTLDRATMGGFATTPALIGQQMFREHQLDFTFRSVVIFNVLCFPDVLGMEAEVAGRGEVVQDTPTGTVVEQVLYRIRLTDGGSGQALDLYHIELSNGYSSFERPVFSGEITIHNRDD
ncbi:MAG: hypothetical protein M3340_12345 [Actinomycetota bacterium]|nr:hypothetical protein [Actinomycetota bacterium]